MNRCRVLVAVAVLALFVGAFAPDAEARRLCSCSHCFGSPLLFCVPPGQSSPIYCFEYYEQNCWHGLTAGEAPDGENEVAFIESLSSDQSSTEADDSRVDAPAADSVDGAMSPRGPVAVIQN